MSSEETEEKDYLQEKIQELMQHSKEELATRLAILELSLQAVDSQTKWIIENINKPWRLVKRNYRPVLGLLVGVTFEPVEFTVWRFEDIVNYQKQTAKREWKFTKIKPSSLLYYEVIEQEQDIDYEEAQTV